MTLEIVKFLILETVVWQVCVLLARVVVHFSACQISLRPFSLYSTAPCLATVSIHADIAYLQNNTKIDLLGTPSLLHISHLPIEFLVSEEQHCLSTSILRNLNTHRVVWIFKWFGDWSQRIAFCATSFSAILYYSWVSAVTLCFNTTKT